MPTIPTRHDRIHLLATILLILLSSASAMGAVAVVQNTGPAATSWPGSPILGSVSNPQSQLSVAEGFGASTTTSYGQTFTITGTDNYSLESISLYAGGGTGTNSTATVTLNLYDVGGGVAPNPDSYSPTANLLGGGNGLPITYNTQSNGILRFDFSGSDQVRLQAGHMYVLEIAGIAATNPLTWLRSTSDTYAGGAAYRSRTWINGTNARDFGLAVYGSVNNDPLPPTQCTVDAGTTHQIIDGFGAGAAYLDYSVRLLTDAQMDALYGTGPNQMGLTLIRVRISPDGIGDWSEPIANGQKAHQRGAKILASPWTPPIAMKDSGVIHTGSLLPAHYQDYVDYLNLFTDTMAASGAPVSVVSLQNEADYDPTDPYDACLWTPAQFVTFCRDFAGGIKIPVMMPEAFAFSHALSDPALNNPASAANIDYIGGHLYGATIRDYPLAHSLGKRTWMTEYLVNEQTIESAIGTAKQVSDCLTIGNMSAYIWWKTIGNANGLLNASGVLQHRAFVMAQFSRFIRPGDVRIAVTGNSSSLAISAFRDRDNSTGRFAIVAVNNNAVPITHTFTLAGLSTTSVTPWITSPTQSLESAPLLPISGDTFTYTIPATSIVTFAGNTVSAEVDLVISRSPGQPGSIQLVINPTRSGWTYTPEFCTNLATADWQLLTGHTTADNGATRTITDSSPAAPARFYRVRVTPPDL